MTEPEQKATMIEFRNVCYSAADKRDVLLNLNLKVDRGETLVLLGRAQQAAGQHETAIATFEHVLELNNKLRQVDYYRGLSELEIGEYAAAVESFEDAILLFPDWDEPKLQLGRAQYLNGDVADGYSTLQVNSSLAKSDEDKAFIYYWRALALEALDDIENANNDWRRLLNLPKTAMPAEWRRTAEDHLDGIYATPTPFVTRTPATNEDGTPQPTDSPTPTASPTP